MVKNDMVETMDLTMEGEPFDELRRNFNIVIQRLIKNMNDTESDEAKISIAVEVKLDKEFIPNYVSGKVDGGRDIKKPTFKHKVTSTISVKDEESGVRNTEMELVWDDEQKMYVLKPVMGGEQMTMNDYMRQQADHASDGDNQETIATDRVKQIGGPTANAGELPGPADDSTEDVPYADFREIGESGDMDGFMNVPDGDEDDGYEYDEPEDGEGE